MYLGRRVSRVSCIPMTKYVFGLTGYMALWADFGVIWWLRWVLEVRVQDWWYCVVRMGD